MTELEQRLLAAFEQLSTELEERSSALEAQNQALSQQVSTLSNQVVSLSNMLERQSIEAVSTDRKLRDDLNKALVALSKQLADLAES